MKQEKYLTFDEFFDSLDDGELFDKYCQFKKECKHSLESNLDFYLRKIEYINEVFVPKSVTKFVPIELKFLNQNDLDNCVEQIINDLDTYGRDEDVYEYGLPFGGWHNERMKEIVTKILTKYETKPTI